jgi:glycosyltransferase involved in cell wall biosynthesis
LKKIYLTVTNDLVFDRRMIRICHSLAKAGHIPVLVGRKLRKSAPLENHPFGQTRLFCWFKKGKIFYLEFQVRLFFFLLSKRMDAICAVDLDTIIPCLLISRIKKIPRVYDAHELFCEMKEVVSRPWVHRTWKLIEKFAVPRFSHAYTVSPEIAEELHRLYKVRFDCIRNVPWLDPAPFPDKGSPYLLYQGAVNQGRSFETLIPAMRAIEIPLVVCGDGNFMEEARRLAAVNGVENRIAFKGMVPPGELPKYTRQARIGLTLFEREGKSNYFSLANRFFDYMHAGLPQVCMDYPAYREINREYKIAVLVSDLSPSGIAEEINKLLANDVLYQELQQNCLEARKRYNWQAEEIRLIRFYKNIFG